MICLGYTADELGTIVDTYCKEHSIKRVFLFHPPRFPITCNHCESNVFSWENIIQYKHYYRILQETDPSTLIVVHEALRTQDRGDLTYNCLRNFLQQTPHQIISSWLPLIDTAEDFCILFDLDTRSRWRREPFEKLQIGESDLRVRPIDVKIERVDVSVDTGMRRRYLEKKQELFEKLGLGDPHTLPRNLYLVAARLRAQAMSPGSSCLARGSRGKAVSVTTYRSETMPDAPYTILDLPHRFIDFADAVALTAQNKFPVMVADLPVDHWYFDRYSAWTERIANVYAAIYG